VTRLSVLNPATEQPIVELDEAGVEEADEAVARAKAAFPAWRDVAPAARAGLLRKVATLVDENAEELARIESENVGKPIAGARAEIGMVASVFHFCSGAVDCGARECDAVRPFRSIWTRDGARALRVARGIDSGVLSINSNSSVRVSTPFGGFKQSGFGRELGMHALAGYSEVRNAYFATE
jgi:acyl-CoA reductase-like NAD-dependent aldehyde dehydrogenase